MPKSCPGCGKQASGKFCPHCGTPLDAAPKCAACGNTIPAGGRFCNMCGVPVDATRRPAAAAASRPSNTNLPWIVAGIAVVVLAAVLIVPRLSTSGGESTTAAAPPAGAPALDPTSVDLSQMSPREAADRLFNRVMQTASAGDTAQALAFAPMAIAAYGMVDSLDADGFYHLAVLQLVSGDAAAARASADSILALTPNHLFGLITAAQAEKVMGDTAAAAELYQRFLDNYDAEMAAERVEYSEHAAILPQMRQEAQEGAAAP